MMTPEEIQEAKNQKRAEVQKALAHVSGLNPHSALVACCHGEGEIHISRIALDPMSDAVMLLSLEALVLNEARKNLRL